MVWVVSFGLTVSGRGGGATTTFFTGGGGNTESVLVWANAGVAKNNKQKTNCKKYLTITDCNCKSSWKL